MIFSLNTFQRFSNLRKVEVLKAGEVEVKPFILDDFVANSVQEAKQETGKKVNKKELKSLAKEIGLNYSDDEIQAIKKLIEVYEAKRVENR